MPKKQPNIITEIQNAELPKVNYAYQKAISYSQMSMYLQCPHKWSLQYKDGHYQNEKSIHFCFGTAMHETLQEWLEVLYNESATKADAMNLTDLFQEKFIAEYTKDYEDNDNTHFSSPEELREFYEDGVEIINFVTKKRKEYFAKRNWHLVGCELPIVQNIGNNLMYKGFIDLVLYNEVLDKFVIFDLKTSTRGWTDRNKKDDYKNMQLVLYKKFFNEQHGIPLENIEVEFFILKRKIFETDDYVVPRVQRHRPAAGRNKLNKANKTLDEFIKDCFTPKGKHQDKAHPKNVTKLCEWCPFMKNGMCDRK